MQLATNLNAVQVKQTAMSLKACLPYQIRIQEMLAKIVWAKYNAAIKAGFSEEQAFIWCRS